MHEDNQNIIILTSDLLFGATILPVANEPLAPVYDDETIRPDVEKVLAYLNEHDPMLTLRNVQEDLTSVSGLREVPKGDPDYFTAVAEEFDRQGLKCIVLTSPLCEVLKPTLPHLAVDDRQKVLDQCLLMPEEEALEFSKDFAEAYDIGKQDL